MMKTYLLFVAAWVMLMTGPAFAGGWDQKCLDYSKQYSHPIGDGAVSSVWGNLVTAFNSKFPSNDHLVMRNRRIKTPYFKKGYFDILEAWPRESYAQKRPFIIFNPGVFTGLRGDHTVEFVRRFTALGYHVIAFANPLDRDFIKYHPNFEVGNVMMQAKAIYTAARAMVHEYKRAGKVDGKVRWVGMSYGGFLTAILANLDATHPQPLGSRDITLFSPPFKLTESISLLDRLILDSRDQGYEYSLTRIARGAWDILWLNNLDPLAARQNPLTLEARGILGEFVFKSGMANALMEWDELTGEVGVPKRRRERLEWKKELLFSDMFERYSPEFSLRFRFSPDNYLATWVKRLRGTGIDVRILSAHDDFINKRIPVESFKKGELIAVKTGGHFGYRILDWFDHFVEKAFSPPLSYKPRAKVLAP